MVINKNNLSIAKFTTDLPERGHASDVLHITDNGTLVVNGPFSIAVSALKKEVSDITGVVTKDHALTLGNTITPSDIQPLGQAFPIDEKYRVEKPAKFEVFLDANILSTVAHYIQEFGGKVVRIRFTGEKMPAELEARNADGQRVHALIMPRTSGVDFPAFVEPTVETDFERAMRLAAAL